VNPPIRATALFPLGQVVATPGAILTIPSKEIIHALGRHSRGDWGVVCDEDTAANDRALKVGARLLSAFESKEGTSFWIITEADRTVTTVLLPGEY
jgi:hypothetical protein